MSITRVRQLIGEWCNELEDIHHNINTLLQSNGHTHTHKQPVIEYLPMMKYNSLNTLTTHTHMPHTHTTHTHTHNTHTERALQYFPTSRKFVDAHQCDMTNKESPPVNIKSETYKQQTEEDHQHTSHGESLSVSIYRWSTHTHTPSQCFICAASQHL
eukprot:GHVR01052951.1.p1 GENE.GHVR01052951.1~~GHVR01052951.1.p1  ORF type:complete len:157 (+),score=86.98 GHVR01052951.1:65-535(+)